jgi:NAD+ kinase
MKIGVVGNPTYPDLGSILATLASAGERHGITFYAEENVIPVWPGSRPAPLSTAPQLDYLLTLGGDGTLLRAARILNGVDTPILGVNLGRVGFLTTISADMLEWALDALARKAHDTEPRLMLYSSIVSKGGKARPEPVALNDVVVHKGGVARVVRLKVSVDGDEVAQYSADGIIVSTPTGSTAYSMSAGGPIVVPGVDAIVVTAICPHTLAVRPLVLPANANVAIQPIPPWSDDVLVSYDGQVGTTIQQGERLEVRRAEKPALLVRLGPESYFKRLRKKLHWGDLTDRVRR